MCFNQFPEEIFHSTDYATVKVDIVYAMKIFIDEESFWV